ncbi:MAG: hypothetical protein ABIH71_04820 [Candidatus Omnitrophota bacterium]
MPIISDSYNARRANSADPDGISGILKNVLSGMGMIMQGNRDKAYRASAAKILGIPEEDLGYFQREELQNMVQEKFKQDIAPKKDTLNEALALEAAKTENAIKLERLKASLRPEKIMAGKPIPASKQIEEEIKTTIAAGGDLKKGQVEYFNKLLKNKGGFEQDMVYTDPNKITAENNQYNPSTVKSWEDVPLLSRIMAAITPSATPEEKALGGLRPGGILQPPQTAPKQSGASQSPYKEYPDAFQEDGVWKVMRAGKKYRIEE